MLSQVFKERSGAIQGFEVIVGYLMQNIKPDGQKQSQTALDPLAYVSGYPILSKIAWL